MKDGELTITDACLKYGIEAAPLIHACGRNGWDDPLAVDKTDNGELVVADDWRLANYVVVSKKVKTLWGNLVDLLTKWRMSI